MKSKSSVRQYRLRYTGNLDKTINFIEENTVIEHQLLVKHIRKLDVDENWECSGAMRCTRLSEITYESLIFN